MKFEPDFTSLEDLREKIGAKNVGWKLPRYELKPREKVDFKRHQKTKNEK